MLMDATDTTCIAKTILNWSNVQKKHLTNPLDHMFCLSELLHRHIPRDCNSTSPSACNMFTICWRSVTCEIASCGGAGWLHNNVLHPTFFLHLLQTSQREKNENCGGRGNEKTKFWGSNGGFWVGFRAKKITDKNRIRTRRK